MMMFIILLANCFDQIYQPKEVEEVKVVSKTEEIGMNEYKAAANRLAKAKLVSISNMSFDLTFKKRKFKG